MYVDIEKNKDIDQENNNNEDETNIYNPMTKNKRKNMGVNLELTNKCQP